MALTPLQSMTHLSAIEQNRALGLAHLKPIDTTPLKRAKIALSLSKAADTEYSVNFAHRLPITMDDKDALDLDAGYVLGSYKDRIRL